MQKYNAEIDLGEDQSQSFLFPTRMGRISRRLVQKLGVSDAGSEGVRSLVVLKESLLIPRKSGPESGFLVR
jgi:hypothetical protein